MSFLRIFIAIIYISLSALAETNNTTLWQNLLNDCKKPTMSCIQNNVYKYFDNALGNADVTVASFMKLKKNDYKYQPETMDDHEDSETERSSPIEEVTEALRAKALKFAFTHDLELSMPDFLFGGGVLKISPRAMDDTGTSFKVEIQPREATGVSDSRLFKKIKKFFTGKLAMALMAILVVIKLLSVKFMFFLPAVMGVAAAKKLLLKVILFIFPFLGHLFKLCPYYQPTKFHHHHHQISHLHHVPHAPSLHGIELDHPPPGWNEEHQHHDGPQHHDNDLGYYSDGPSFAADFSSHRKNFDVYKPVRHDEDGPLYDGGQGQSAAVGHRGPPKPVKTKSGGPLTPTEIENMVLKAEKEAMLKARLQEEQKRVELENKRLQERIKNAMKLQEKLKIHSIVAKQTNKITAAANSYHSQNMISPQVIQPHIVHAVPASHLQGHSYIQHPVVQIPQSPIYQHPGLNLVAPSPPPPQPQTPIYTPTPAPKLTFDAFYSPILEKIDKVLVELGFHDESCRERLICSMYKNPTKFSPHSNLVSAELSRDSDELQKPTSSNTAVIRFYKYVQAARDGQDKRDCLRLYPSCAIITER